MTPGIDNQDLHYLPRLQETLADDLYRRSAIPQLLFVPVLGLMYLSLASAIEKRPAIGWVFAGFALLLLPRMLSILGYERLRRRLPDPQQRILVFSMGSAMVGLGLGTINVMSAPVVTVEQVALLALIAAGISSVSIVSMNPSLRSYFLSMVPSVGTLPIVLLLGPEMQHRGIFLILVVVNLISAVIMATYVHVNICKAIVLRLKVDDANAKLQSEVAERQAAERALAERNRELEALNDRLAGAQSALLQSEKMASIGQLAAGVAHEINNPIAFVRANLHSLDGYARDILAALDHLDAAAMANANINPEFLREDIPALLAESIEGVTRVEKIVKDLKEFSHLDEADWQKVDLHQGIDTTLNVAAHELKYKVDVVREYGDLPAVECLPFQINQVLLNILINAAQSIDTRGRITITTGRGNHDDIWIRIADTGKGIEAAHLKRIFEPFFTTKPVGVGTGLGLSVSYSIVRRHGGNIEVASEVGVGTAFTIRLPVVGKRPG